MLSVSRIWKCASIRCTALLVLAAFTACDDDDGAGPGGDPEPPPPHTLGFVELRFEGLRTQDPTVTALVAPTLAELETLSAQRERGHDIRDRVAFDLTQPPGGDGTIQLNHRVFKRTDHNGWRYFHSTFHVRNAQRDSAAYDTDRHNLTFIPVWTDHTIPETPVRRLRLHNGNPADPSIALQMRPTGLVRLQGGNHLVPVHADVVQFFTDEEVRDIGGTGVQKPLPLRLRRPIPNHGYGSHLARLAGHR